MNKNSTLKPSQNFEGIFSNTFVWSNGRNIVLGKKNQRLGSIFKIQSLVCDKIFKGEIRFNKKYLILWKVNTFCFEIEHEISFAIVIRDKMSLKFLLISLMLPFSTNAGKFWNSKQNKEVSTFI